MKLIGKEIKWEGLVIHLVQGVCFKGRGYCAEGHGTGRLHEIVPHWWAANLIRPLLRCCMYKVMGRLINVVAKGGKYLGVTDSVCSYSLYVV